MSSPTCKNTIIFECPLLAKKKMLAVTTVRIPNLYHDLRERTIFWLFNYIAVGTYNLHVYSSRYQVDNTKGMELILGFC